MCWGTTDGEEFTDHRAMNVGDRRYVGGTIECWRNGGGGGGEVFEVKVKC